MPASRACRSDSSSSAGSRSSSAHFCLKRAVVVEDHLGVESQQPVLAREGQGVDFDKGSIVVDEGAHQAFGYVGEVAHMRAKAHAESQVARLEVKQAEAGVYRELDDGVWVLFGYLLDLHAALGAAHYDDGLGAAINGGPQVVFFLDVGGIGNQHALDLFAFGVLLVLEHFAQDVFGVLTRCLDVFGIFDAASLAASAHHHLGLDHYGLAYALGDILGFLRRVGYFALVDGHAILGEQFFGLVFVELHVKPPVVFGFRV